MSHLGRALELAAQARGVAYPNPVVGADPAPDACFSPSITAPTSPVDKTEPSSTFLSPGTHTITVSRDVNFNDSTNKYVRTVGSKASASITFHRVNADGTPYGS